MRRIDLNGVHASEIAGIVWPILRLPNSRVQSECIRSSRLIVSVVLIGQSLRLIETFR